MDIEVSVTEQYGNVVVRPFNAAAQTLANIAGTRTLTIAALARAETLGHKVVVMDGTLANIETVSMAMDRFSDLA